MKAFRPNDDEILCVDALVEIASSTNQEPDHDSITTKKHSSLNLGDDGEENVVKRQKRLRRSCVISSDEEKAESTTPSELRDTKKLRRAGLCFHDDGNSEETCLSSSLIKYPIYTSMVCRKGETQWEELF